jgi:hypothetical protein
VAILILQAELLNMERAVGWSQPEPLVMWNPPWTLPLISPLGMLDYDTAQFIWFLLHALIIFVGAQILWQCYTGERKYARYGLVSVLVFPPIYFALLLGQIGPLILLGIIGFVFFAQREAWFFAGASLSLVSVKPHVCYLLWIALIFWVIKENVWQLALGAAVAGLLLVLTPLWWNARDLYTVRGAIEQSFRRAAKSMGDTDLGHCARRAIRETRAHRFAGCHPFSEHFGLSRIGGSIAPAGTGSTRHR